MLYGNQEQQDMSLQVVILHQYAPADGAPSSMCPCRWHSFVNMPLQIDGSSPSQLSVVREGHDQSFLTENE